MNYLRKTKYNKKKKEMDAGMSLQGQGQLEEAMPLEIGETTQNSTREVWIPGIQLMHWEKQNSGRH